VSDKLAQVQAARNGGRRADLARGDALPPLERRALVTLRKEARAQESTLTTGGKGGLPPSLVLGRMRRDDYKCKSCGRKGGADNGGVGVHHKGGIVDSAWLSKKGHRNDFDNLVTICADCHDREHENAKDRGTDSTQVTPEADVGTRRDHGLPRAGAVDRVGQRE
jgi:5-methylcytosine-specific restriction endonuclease McrA